MNMFVAFWVMALCSFEKDTCCINKESFVVFINSLHSRGAVRGDADVYYIHSDSIEYICFFLENITIEERKVRIEIVDSIAEKSTDLIMIKAVRFLTDGSMSIVFSSNFDSALYSGSINMEFEANRPIFRTAFIVKKIE